MYPFIEFKGEIICKNIVDYTYDVQNNSVALFSLGLDSTNTVISNLDKNLTLVSLHGSDIPLNEDEGFENFSSAVNSFASRICSEVIYVKSNFRENLHYKNLDATLPGEMKKSWWHQFQHGIAIISHAAIVAYFKKSKNIFIASSLSDQSAKFNNVKYDRCASSPIIDNNFKFSNCSVIHDGYEYERIDKLKNVIRYAREHDPVFLRVCFTSKKGYNCSRCDKCSRSILGLISENEDPKDYGFKVNETTLPNIKKNLDNLKMGKQTRGWSHINFRNYFWMNLQENFIKNSEKYEFGDDVNWILDYDFTDMYWK